MSSVKISYKTDAVNEMLKKAASVGEEGIREILDRSIAVVFRNNKKRFLAQEDPDGKAWPESMAAKRRRTDVSKGGEGRDGGTLFNTGDLFHSLEVRTEGRNGRVLYTDIPYARRHQEGTDGMIERKFLGFGDDDITMTRKIMIEEYNRRIK
jgi:phage gpG-like protein